MNIRRAALLSCALTCATVTTAVAADVLFMNDAQLLQALRSARPEAGDASGIYAVPLPSESKSVVWGIRRTKPTAAEIHEAFDDVWSWSSWSRAYKGGFINLSADLTFANLWSLDASTRISPQTMSDAQTRGGPLMVSPASAQVEMPPTPENSPSG